MSANGTLVRPPDLRRVGRFDAVTPYGAAGAAGYVAPAQALDGRWGYVDQTGRWLVEPALERAKAFSGGLARFRRDGRWGYLNDQGEIVIEPRFGDAAGFGDGSGLGDGAGAGLAPVRVDEGWCYVDRGGRVVISGPFTDAERFSAGLAAVRIGDRWGYIDADGVLVIRPRFAFAKPFSSKGAAPVQDPEAAWGQGWGLIDRQGGWIVEPRYLHMGEFTGEGLVSAHLWDSGEGFVDAHGSTVVAHQSGLSGRMVCGLARLGHGSSSVSFVGGTGAVAIAGPFTWAMDFRPCGATVALRGEDWGVLRADGEFIPLSHREPLADQDEDHGGVHGFSLSGLAPFVTYEGDVVHVDTHGREVCRIEVAVPGAAGRATGTSGQTPFTRDEGEGGLPVRDAVSGGPERVSRIRDAGGGEVWRSDPASGVFSPEPAFLRRDAAYHFADLAHWEGDVVATAEKLLAAEPRRFLPYTVSYGGDRDGDVYDLSGADEDDVEEYAGLGALEELAADYAYESTWGAYPFLGADAETAFEHYFATLAERLSARYGPADVAGPGCLLQGDGDDLRAWRVGDRFLVLQRWAAYPGGSFEHQLWLAAVLVRPETSGG
ncbi:WG repeat-containing protein [Streptosporangium carneum]|uniref:WG repeat-containing protein n=1 Tax=Streptosporangium carneum TaxID=47481 RepID=UPI0022F2D42C|nr:WG repeat-containing protein [Streptosporangium carneum]